MVYQNAKIFTASNYYTASVNEARSNIAYYFKLKDENSLLSQQNALLFQQKFNSALQNFDTLSSPIFNDTLPYKLIAGKVINSTINLPENFLTLNVGALHGVKAEMGVISDYGVVGIVKDVSEHFSTVIPLINSTFSISASVKRLNYFGFYEWPGNSYKYAVLNDIPQHVNLTVGDTLVTRGASGIFPVGIPLATVSSVLKKPGRNYLEVDLELLTNFRTLKHVYVIDNALKEEQKKLENQF